jgi:carbamoyltransferase
MEDNLLFDYLASQLVPGLSWAGLMAGGARALGGRYLVPEEPMPRLLNSKIKRRESFRPFAPSILEEFVDEYFEIQDTVPFMEKCFQSERKTKSHSRRHACRWNRTSKRSMKIKAPGIIS